MTGVNLPSTGALLFTSKLIIFQSSYVGTFPFKPMTQDGQFPRFDGDGEGLGEGERLGDGEGLGDGDGDGLGDGDWEGGLNTGYEGPPHITKTMLSTKKWIKVKKCIFNGWLIEVKLGLIQLKISSLIYMKIDFFNHVKAFLEDHEDDFFRI